MKKLFLLPVLFLISCAATPISDIIPRDDAGEFDYGSVGETLLRVIKVEGGTRTIWVEDQRKTSVYWEIGLMGMGLSNDHHIMGINFQPVPEPPLPIEEIK